MNIKHLRHNEINKIKWDSTVNSSDTGLPYFFTWYLDAVSPNWEALVADDYNFIMPLPVKIKYGIKYLFQPQWTQQLGILSKNNNLNQEIIDLFIVKIPYLFYCLNLNHTNNYNKLKIKQNLTLNLFEEAYSVRSGYNTNTIRNIRKAKRSNLNIDKLSDNEILKFYCLVNNDTNSSKINTLQKLMQAAVKNGIGKGYGVWQNGELVAALFALQTKNRFIYLNPISSTLGKETRAMFLMIDTLIEEMSNSKLVFDFEGSMIPGVRKFYLGFGAKVEQYGEVSRMKTEKILSLLIKIRDKF